jgi:hypothetical protein
MLFLLIFKKLFFSADGFPSSTCTGNFPTIQKTGRVLGTVLAKRIYGIRNYILLISYHAIVAYILTRCRKQYNNR